MTEYSWKYLLLLFLEEVGLRLMDPDQGSSVGLLGAHASEAA